MRSRLLLLALAAVVVMCAMPSVALAKTRSVISVSLSSQLEHYGSKPVLSAQIKDASGRILRYKSLSLYRDGKRVASARTNSQGRTTFKLVLPRTSPTSTPNATGKWQVRFAGDSRYWPGKSAEKVTSTHVDYYGALRSSGASLTAAGTFMYSYRLDVSLAKGQLYAIYSNTPVTIGIGYPSSTAYLAGSGETTVTSFEYRAPTTARYRLSFWAAAALVPTTVIRVTVW